MMWDPEALAAGRVRLGFFPDKPTRFGIIPRFGTDADVRWFDASAMFMYHTVNAWEEGDEVVLVGCRIDQPFADEANADDPVPDDRLAAPGPHLLGVALRPAHRAPPGSARWTTPWPSSPAWTTAASAGRPATRTTRCAPRRSTLQFTA